MRAPSLGFMFRFVLMVLGLPYLWPPKVLASYVYHLLLPTKSISRANHAREKRASSDEGVESRRRRNEKVVVEC